MSHSNLFQNQSAAKIRFACVEYSTKTGKIWRPTPEKPNYFCDPETEIDPTSFGCWTSALAGEHIPVNFLQRDALPPSLAYKIGRKVDEIFAKIQKRPVYRNLHYIKRFNLILLLVHSFSLPLMADLIQRVKKIHPAALYLGSIDSPLGKLREVWQESSEYHAFKTFADHCDLFINVNQAAQNYLAYITKTPVVYLPQFYPFAYAKKFWQPRETREKTILIGGETSRLDNLSGQFAAIQIQKQHPAFLIKIVDNPHLNIEPLKLAQARFEIIPFLPWRKHLRRLAHFFMVVNLDAIWTLGRLQSDCAAVGTPSIGINSNNQMEFFPRLTCADICEIDRVVELAGKLITDQKFYQEIQEEARNKVAQSSYQHAKKRLEQTITKYWAK